MIFEAHLLALFRKTSEKGRGDGILHRVGVDKTSDGGIT
jgi:hypothetical protein